MSENTEHEAQTETPRTEAVALTIADNLHFIPIDFARQLERENQQLRADLAASDQRDEELRDEEARRWQDAIRAKLIDIASLERQRDELAERLAESEKERDGLLRMNRIEKDAYTKGAMMHDERLREFEAQRLAFIAELTAARAEVERVTKERDYHKEHEQLKGW